MSSPSRAFAAYVPRLIFRHPDRATAPPVDAAGDRLPAVALFADIAGSTALANRLAKHGRLVGPEEMCRLLNAYYAPLVSLLEARGGDVIGFAGDAVLAVWPGEPGRPLGPAVRQAAQAALEVQRDLNDLELAPGVRLSLRICIGAGELATALVGGRQGFWQLVAYGAPLDQIRAAGDAARVGLVHLSAEAAAEADRDMDADPAPGGGVYVRRVVTPPPAPGNGFDLSALPDSVLRPYVPRAVQDGVDAGVSDFLAQSRTVSTLFVRVLRPPGSTPAWDRIRDVMAVLQDAMDRYTGTVVQLIEDDKGLVAVLAFGLPPAGHEDDASRAVAAAGHLRELARDRRVACGIGISTGLPFCGPLGSPTRRYYAVIGPDVVRSARLMQLAGDGDILCDDDTRAAAEPAGHRFAPLPRFRFKGFDAPVRAFRVRTAGDVSRDDLPGRLRATALGDLLTAHLRADPDPTAVDRLLADDRLVVDHGVCELVDGPAARPRAADPATRPLIGRVAERAAFATALDAATAGDGRTVLVEGDIGVGKSRLLAEARRTAVERGVVAVGGLCSAVESATPYYPWRAILGQLLDPSGLGSTADRRERLLAALGIRPPLVPLAPLVNDLLGLALPEDDVVRQMTGQTRADGLTDVIVGVIDAAAAGRPLLIALDDAQWADASSWRMAAVVRERVGRTVLAVALRRSDGVHPPAFTDDPAVVRVDLRPLSATETRNLARGRLGADRLDDPAAALVWSRSQGNPLYVEQMVDHLAATGSVAVRDGTACLQAAGGGAEPDVPDTIRGLVTARIDRLRLAHQITAKVASVIGPVFPWRASVSIHPAPTADLPGHAAELTREQVIRQDRPDPDAVYAFPHPVVQQVCYDLLKSELRKGLHNAAAKWFEADRAAGGSPPDRLVAHHWAQAGEPDRQAAALARAGEAAARDGAFREAVVGFDELLRLSRSRFGDDPPAAEAAARAHWEYRLGEAHVGVGDLPAAVEHLQTALALHGRPLRSSRAGLAVDCLVQAARQAVHRLLPARRTPPADDPTGREVTAAYNRLGRVRYFMSEILPGTNCVLRALNAGEATGPSPERATAYAGAMILAGLLNRRRTARLYARLAEATSRAAGGLPNQSTVITYLCMHHLGLGGWDAVAALARESLDYAERVRDHHQTGDALTVWAMLDCFRGDYPAAGRWAARMIESSRLNGNALLAAWALNIQGECDLRLGRYDDAASWLDAAAAALAGKQGRTEEIRIAGLRAELAVRTGNRAAAATHADAAEAVAGQVSVVTCSTLEGFAGVAAARFAAAEADPTDRPARTAAAAALGRLRKHARLFPPWEPRTAFYDGRLHRLAGSPGRAVRAWRRGLDRATALRMPYDTAVLNEALGRHAPSGSAERRDHLAAAVERYILLGMGVEATRLLELPA